MSRRRGVCERGSFRQHWREGWHFCRGGRGHPEETAIPLRNIGQITDRGQQNKHQ